MTEKLTKNERKFVDNLTMVCHQFIIDRRRKVDDDEIAYTMTLMEEFYEEIEKKLSKLVKVPRGMVVKKVESSEDEKDNDSSDFFESSDDDKIPTKKPTKNFEKSVAPDSDSDDDRIFEKSVPHDSDSDDDMHVTKDRLKKTLKKTKDSGKKKVGKL